VIMGILLYLLTNVGDHKAEVIARSDKTKMALGINGSYMPNIYIGYESDPATIAVLGGDSLTWKLYDGGKYRLQVDVSRDRGTTYRPAGVILVNGNLKWFNVWICNNSIVIENTQGVFQRLSDLTPFRFFVATEGGTVGSNDPACMLDYVFE